MGLWQGSLRKSERALLRRELPRERRVERLDVEPAARPRTSRTSRAGGPPRRRASGTGPRTSWSSAGPARLEEVRDGVAQRARAARRRDGDAPCASSGSPPSRSSMTARRNSGVPAMGAYVAHSTAGTSCTARAAVGQDGELAVVVEQRPDRRVDDRLARCLPLRRLLVEGEDGVVRRAALVRGDEVNHVRCISHTCSLSRGCQFVTAEAARASTLPGWPVRKASAPAKAQNHREIAVARAMLAPRLPMPRRSRLRPHRACTFLVLVAVSLLAAATAEAQDADGALSSRHVAYASPQHFEAELRFAPFTPAIDGDPSLHGATPYATVFGTSPRILVSAELDWQILRFPHFGTLGRGSGSATPR